MRSAVIILYELCLVNTEGRGLDSYRISTRFRFFVRLSDSKKSGERFRVLYSSRKNIIIKCSAFSSLFYGG